MAEIFLGEEILGCGSSVALSSPSVVLKLEGLFFFFSTLLSGAGDKGPAVWCRPEGGFFDFERDGWNQT